MEKTVLMAGVAGLMAFSFIQQPTEKSVMTPVKIEAKVQPATQAKPVLKQTSHLKPITVKQVSTPTVAVIKSVPVKLVLDTVPQKPASPAKREQLSFPSISTSISDVGKTKTSTIEAIDESGKKYRINKINDRITEMYVNDVAIPENEFSKYQSVIEQIDMERAANALEARKRSEESRQRSLIEREKRMMERDARVKVDREKRTKEILERNARNKERTEQTTRANRERSMRRYTSDKGDSNRDISSMINDLSNAKVIEDRENLSFSLNNESLTVNGKKQSSDLHNKLKEKYIHKSGDSYIYSRKGNSTTITINIE